MTVEVEHSLGPYRIRDEWNYFFYDQDGAFRARKAKVQTAEGAKAEYEAACRQVDKRRLQGEPKLKAQGKPAREPDAAPIPPAESPASAIPPGGKSRGDLDRYELLADCMMQRLDERGAKFVRDESGVYILLPGRHSAILIGPQCVDYITLQHRYLRLGTVEHTGRIVCQRVLIKAGSRAGNSRRVKFSFASQEQILVPVEGGKILRIRAEGFSLVENGTDQVWLEHPREEPLPWTPEADPREGLRRFEELLVHTLAVPCEAKRFLLGIHFGLVPFVRQLLPARPLAQLIGQKGQGKTSGGERYLLLYRLGKVQGDYSLAQVKRDGDVGLVIRDNVETLNLTKGHEDYFLFAATGGEWARVGAGRTTEHPIVGVTTIEGIGRRSETHRRLLSFEFELNRDESFSESKLQASIECQRAVIFRGVAELLRSMLAQSPVPNPPAVPMPDFTDYCFLVYRLLHAWEHVARKADGFADGVFREWARLHGVEEEGADSAGPYPRLLEALIAKRMVVGAGDPLRETVAIEEGYAYGAHRGRVFIATPNGWLTELKRIAQTERDVVLPARPEGLRNRLEGLKPKDGYILLTEKHDKLFARHGRRRLWGILEIGDG